jgi:steroid delta-isomerase-like uncharacterized protein
MSDQNKQLLRRAIEEVWNQGNFGVIDQLYADDFVHRGNALPTTVGLDALRQFVLALRTAFPDARFTIERLVSESDLIVCQWRLTGVHRGDWLGVPGTGKPTDVTGISINRVKNGRIAEQLTSNWDAMLMWQQLGLLSDPTVMAANKALVRRYMEEVWNQGLLDSVDELFAPDSHFYAPHSGEFRGLPARKEFVGALRAAFPDVHYTINELLADGAKVTLRWAFSGTHRGVWAGIAPTGKTTVTSGTSTFLIGDGKIRDELIQWDALGYMQQLGVTPASAGAQS